MIEGIKNFQDYKVVLVTRDPRDILVSGYYSVSYSHGLPSERGDKYDAFMSKRMAARECTIDEYVLLESDRIYDIFSRYQSLLLDQHDHIYITTYEDMVSNFEVWLMGLLRYCELDLDKIFIQKICAEHEAHKPKGEDRTQHVRKGVPGDYKEKLRPETILALDQKFEPILRRYHE
jgi:hypothetical protein